MLLEGALETPTTPRARRAIRIAANDVTAERIDEGQRVAVSPVAQAKLTLEVCGPNIIRCLGFCIGRGVAMRASPSLLVSDEAMSLQDVAGGALGLGARARTACCPRATPSTSSAPSADDDGAQRQAWPPLPRRLLVAMSAGRCSHFRARLHRALHTCAATRMLSRVAHRSGCSAR